MKHDKSDRDLNKDVSMPGSSGSKDIKSDRPLRGNLEESEVGASKGDLGSSSGTSGSSSSGSRTGSSGGSGDINR